PRSASRPRASFWMARMLFDQGKDVEACRRLGDAASTTPSGQVELRNQIDYMLPRCAGIDTTRAGAPMKPAAGAAPSAATQPELTVQIAAFSNHDSAEKLRARLQELGYDARIASSETLYRVRVGRYSTRAEADSVVARMRAQHVDG